MAGRAIAIARDEGAAPTALLERALDRIGLNRHFDELACGRDGFTAIIVPALDAFAAGSPAATDPRLVEHLIDILFDRGAGRVDIGSTRDSSALWLENRDPFMIAELLGYRYETPKGRAYDVLDLSGDAIDGGFPATGPLAGSTLSAAWLDADLRIVFAANRTDEDDGYALCLATLLGVLPLTDKNYHYRMRRDPGAVAQALLDRAAVDLALIDATVSVHGNGGARAPEAIGTHTIIAATDPVLADHYGAILMGLDPCVSQTVAPALRRPGWHADVRLHGTLDPYPGWRNVDPMLIAVTGARRKSVALDRSVRPLLQQVDRSLFPFSNPANDQANAMIAPVFDSQDAASLIAANLWLACAGSAYAAWATHFDKDALRRRDAPIDIDPASVADAFAGVAAELRPLSALLRGVAPDETGLRWRMHDDAVLFDGVRRFPIPYAHFIAAVGIHRTIEYMNDYIGGSAIAVAHDEYGRITRQIERNLYLPQPNYTVLFGGDVIDVTKIETIVYAPRRQQMAWKTVRSANESALADDGIVTFEALGDDTLVTIWGRQRFRLPPLLAAIDLNLVPALRAMLVTDAYRRFFRHTFANLEAVAEGRDVAIGRPWAEEEEPLAIERIATLLTELGEHGSPDLLGWIKSIATRADDRPSPVRIDDNGFHHFESMPKAVASSPRGIMRELAADLLHAAKIDAGAAG
ncbi:MAG: DUF362 domain-containing protein [Sphingomonas bacterium]